MTAIKCTRPGCGKEFSQTSTTAGDCYFHAGAPIFHDGLKGWNCCKKRVTGFDEFLTIPGCTPGSHSSEPFEPPKPVVTAPGANDRSPGAAQRSQEQPKEQKKDGEPQKESFGVSQAAPSQPATPKPQKKEPLPEPDDDLSVPVAANAKCKRRGCGAAYVNEEVSRRKKASKTSEAGGTDEPLCLYHPGVPVFHEGSKGYTCCARKVLEFDEFLKLKGCRKAVNHRFVALDAGEQEKAKQRQDVVDNVELRTDWYQTATSVILSVFGKKADKNASRVTFAEREISVYLKLPDGKEYRKFMPLSQPIAPADCTYEILGTKAEITMKKANGISWASIEPNDNIQTWTTFGVSGGMGTVGGKEMFLAHDAPLYSQK